MTKHETKSQPSQAQQKASQPPHGGDPLERLMKRFKVPVTRQSYLDLAYLGKPPAELSAEEELDLPAHLQRAPHKRQASPR